MKNTIEFTSDYITDHSTAKIANMRNTIMLLGLIYGYYDEFSCLNMVHDGKWYTSILLQPDFLKGNGYDANNRDTDYMEAIDMMSDYMCENFGPFIGMNKNTVISVTSEYCSLRIAARCHISELISFIIFTIFMKNKPNIGALSTALFDESIQPLNRDEFYIYERLLNNWKLMVYKFYIDHKIEPLKSEVMRYLEFWNVKYEKV